MRPVSPDVSHLSLAMSLMSLCVSQMSPAVSPMSLPVSLVSLPVSQMSPMSLPGSTRPDHRPQFRRDGPQKHIHIAGNNADIGFEGA
jgi:hypothetical protein